MFDSIPVSHCAELEKNSHQLRAGRDWRISKYTNIETAKNKDHEIHSVIGSLMMGRGNRKRGDGSTSTSSRTNICSSVHNFIGELVKI